MPRRKTTVRQLASEAGRSVDDVAGVLRAAGIRVCSHTDYVPKSKLAVARSKLGLHRRDPDTRAIASIARRAESTEVDVRKLLVEAGLLKKARLTRLASAQLLPQAETLLGIRRVSTKWPAEGTAGEVAVGARIEGKVEAERRSQPDTPDTPHTPDALGIPIVGKVQEIRYLSPTDIETIHYALVNDFRVPRIPLIRRV